MHIVEHIAAAFQEAARGPTGSQPGAGAQRARIREAARAAEVKHYYRHTSFSDAPSRQQQRRAVIYSAKRATGAAYREAVSSRRKPTFDKTARPPAVRQDWRAYRAEWLRIAALTRPRSPSPSSTSPGATGERAARPPSPPTRGRAAQTSRVPA